MYLSTKYSINKTKLVDATIYELEENIGSLTGELEESKKAETILSTYKIKNESQLDEIVAEIKMKVKQMQKIPLTINSGQLVETASLDSHAKTIYENIVSLEKSTKGFDQQQFLRNIESREDRKSVV